MTAFYLVVTLFLLGNLIVGLWRVLRGPSVADSLLAAQLLGTTTVAIILLLSQVQADGGLIDVALVFAVLSAVTAVAFVRRAWALDTDQVDVD